MALVNQMVRNLLQFYVPLGGNLMPPTQRLMQLGEHSMTTLKHNIAQSETVKFGIQKLLQVKYNVHHQKWKIIFSKILPLIILMIKLSRFE